MKPMDDVWTDISSLPYLHHPTTSHHFQDFFAPAPTPAALHHPSPPPPPPPPPVLPLTTMLSLSTSSNSRHDDQEPPAHTNSTTGATSPHVVKVKQTSSPQYTEKFKRLMKNRESAARSRARKQARADELEHEVVRLTKENAKLKRLHKELCSASTAQVPKKPRLHRSKSAPL